MARVIPTDQKRRIEFLYWLEPDCSTPELPAVRVIEQPKNGTLAIESGMGFSNYPQSNLRFECNKRKSDGISVMYQSNARYTGPDSTTVEIIWPNGQSTTRRFLLDVKTVESISSVPNPVRTN